MKRTTVIAAALLAVIAATLVVGMVLTATAPAGTVGLDFDVWTGAIVIMGFTLTGAILAVKVPSNAIGWILLTSVALISTAGPGNEIMRRLQSETPSILMFVTDSLFFLGIALLLSFLFGLFPTGRFPGPKWRFLGYSAVGGIVLSQLSAWARSCTQQALWWPTPDTALPSCSDPLQPWFVRFENPLGAVGGAWEGFSATTGAVGGILVLVAMFGGIISLLARYRSGTSTERLQLRWLVSILALLTPVLVVLMIIEASFDLDIPYLFDFVIVAFALGVPITIGIAILRHDLFDIDRLMSRTATYTIVGFVLVGIYALIAIVLPTALWDESNSLAVAASTLAVAALFNPVRNRIQGWTDRRFNRLPYDPVSVSSTLAGQLRDNVEAANIAQDWVTAATGALEPAVVGVWVKSA